ncbi:hypothetical protein [Priestia megaterium]|uniref:hypothetical protein n=1 Tax=Priestia megaterium TaxID=1404 RepID=UPI002A69D0FF|nr:hypothetical protein [Priestia megaterium]MDY0940792.1 hypothetical protein [Priestia megaterium]
MCAGKTTVGEKVAEKLNIPQCSRDEVRFSYYREIGFSKETQQNIREEQDFKTCTPIGSRLKHMPLKEY